MSEQKRIEQLETEVTELQRNLAAKEKICQVLMDRVERSVDSVGGAFSIFERNILLQSLIDQRSQELEEANKKLSTEITERINSERRLYSVIQGSPIPTFVIGDDHKVLYWNSALEQLTGVKAEEVLNTNEHRKAFYDKEGLCVADILLQKAFAKKSEVNSYQLEKSKIVDGAFEYIDYYPGIGEDGSWLKITAAEVRDVQGFVVGAIETIEDITERKLAEEKLRELSLKDDLTGIHNRRGFIMLAEQQLNNAQRLKQNLLLLFIDVDDMKWINDNLGHNEGDQALIDAASVLQKSFRKSDIIARIGGDEFVGLAVVTSKVTSERILYRLQRNLEIINKRKDARPYQLYLSIGVTSFDPDKPCNLEQLINQGDEMMYKEKRSKDRS